MAPKRAFQVTLYTPVFLITAVDDYFEHCHSPRTRGLANQRLRPAGDGLFQLLLYFQQPLGSRTKEEQTELPGKLFQEGLHVKLYKRE